MIEWKNGLLQRAILVAVLAGIGLLLPLLQRPFAGLYPPLSWLLDLAVHWQWLYLTLLLLACAVAALLRSRWALLVLLAPLPLLTASPALPEAERPNRPLSLVSVNLGLHNPDAAKLLAWLDRVRPDLVLVQELTPALASQLDTGLADYPHRAVFPAADPFGIGLYARLPLQRAERVAPDGIGQIQATLSWQGRPVELAVIHPMPPLSPAFQQQRDRQLLDLATALAEPDQARLMVGDFNATPWSGLFAGLAEQGLYRAGGLQPTWPSVLPWVGLPIDQVLASRHWRLLDRQVGPAVGSDHRPIGLRLQGPARLP